MADPNTIQIPVEAFRPHRWMVESLADEQHRFKVHRWHRRARKTTLGLNKLIRAACLAQRDTFAYIGPTYTQTRSILLRDPLMLRQYLPRQVLRRDFNESDLTAEFVTGSVLRCFGADDPDRLRGIRFKGVVLDEWALQKRAIFDEILYPVLLESRGWCDFYFTPKGRNHAWEFWRRGQGAAHPDWRTFDLAASQSGLLSAEALAQARREMGEDLYRQEMECEFLEDVQAVFRGLDLCLAGDLAGPVAGRKYVLGVDLGRTHDATFLVLLDAGTRQVAAQERLTENHWALQRQAIAALAHRYGALVCVDETGVGSPITEDLRDLGLRVLGVKFTATSKRDLIDRLRVAVAQQLITIPPACEQLIRELRDFEYKLPQDGTFSAETVRYGAPEGEGFFDDGVIALALAVHALQGDLYRGWAETERQVKRYEDAAEELTLASAHGGYGFR